MKNNLPNLSKELLDKYFDLIVLRSKTSEEIKELSEKIKYEMEKSGRKEIIINGYKVNVEIKNAPTEKFFELMCKKGLEYLITPTIETKNLRKAKMRLGLSDDEYYSKYTKELESKWLYVRKEGNDCLYLSNHYG